MMRLLVSIEGLLDGREADAVPIVRGLDVVCTRHEGTTEFSLHGELDIGSAETFERVVADTANAGVTRIVIEIGSLRFIDLVGVRALLDIESRCAAACTALVFRGIPASQVARILALVRASERLGIPGAAG